MLPMLFLVLAGLFGDSATPVAAMWRRAWPWVVLTAALVVFAFAPAQWLHGMNHQWAIGAGPVMLWALMSVRFAAGGPARRADRDGVLPRLPVLPGFGSASGPLAIP